MQWVPDSGAPTVLLGLDELSAVECTWYPVSEGPVQKVRVDTFYFAQAPASETEVATRRAAVTAYAESLRTALLFRPPIVKQLARGAAFIPNIHDNFGDLETVAPTPLVILETCVVFDVEVVDDDGIHGIGISVTFGKVAPCASPGS